MKELDFVCAQRERREFGFMDDFLETYKTTYLWTSLLVGSTPTVTNISGSAGGQVALFTDAVQNNEVGIYTSQKPFIFVAAKPLHFEVNLQYTEANTNEANIAVGFASSLSATGVLTTAGVPNASFSGALIYKALGTTTWSFVTSVGSTQTITASTATAGGATAQVLEIECKVISATQVDCVPKVNGVQMTDANNKPIKQTLVLTGAVAMYAGVYARAGSASAETINVDQVIAYQLRQSPNI